MESLHIFFKELWYNQPNTIIAGGRVFDLENNIIENSKKKKKFTNNRYY